MRDQRAIDVKVDTALAARWPLKRVEAVLRAILRAGAYELMYRRDVPARVAITEYVDVAHGFYGEDEPGLVNAVLDAVAHEVRAEEFFEGAVRGREAVDDPTITDRRLRPARRGQDHAFARRLAAEIGAVYLRIDSIEAGLARSALAIRPAEDAGYEAAYAVAEDNLRNGLSVIADCVNPIALSRDAWADTAARAERGACCASRSCARCRRT